MSLLAPPTAPTNTYPLSGPSTNRTASHGRPVLETGYGLKDWIRLSRRSTDMSGTNGHMLRVTPHELAKHCTEEDAWTAINGEPLSALGIGPPLVDASLRPTRVVTSALSLLRPGRVYNISPYLKFHPGSASELMRGAGKDCTDLFNQVGGEGRREW